MDAVGWDLLYAPRSQSLAFGDEGCSYSAANFRHTHGLDDAVTGPSHSPGVTHGAAPSPRLWAAIRPDLPIVSPPSEWLSRAAGGFGGTDNRYAHCSARVVLSSLRLEWLGRGEQGPSAGGGPASRQTPARNDWDRLPGVQYEVVGIVLRHCDGLTASAGRHPAGEASGCPAAANVSVLTVPRPRHALMLRHISYITTVPYA